MMLKKTVFFGILASLMQHNNAIKPNIVMFVMDDLGWNDASYEDPTFKHQRLINWPMKESDYSNTMSNEYVLLQDLL